MSSLKKIIKRSYTKQVRPIPLFYKKVESVKEVKYPPLVIIHGLMGNFRNFSTFYTNKIVKENRDIYAIDVRNHGSSPWDPRMDYEAMKEDLKVFLSERNLEEIDLLGFSMGGKLAMNFALDDENSNKIRKLIIGDVAPVHYELNESTIPKTIYALDKLNLNELKTRQAIDQELSKDITSKDERAFLLTNLVFKDDKVGWRVNLRTIIDNLKTLMSFPSDFHQFEKPTLFLKGTRSPLVAEKFYPEIEKKFSNYKIVEFETGHWLHAEQPQKFLNEVTQFINQ
eukprot:gene5019-8617_t